MDAPRAREAPRSEAVGGGVRPPARDPRGAPRRHAAEGEVDDSPPRPRQHVHSQRSGAAGGDGLGVQQAGRGDRPRALRQLHRTGAQGRRQGEGRAAGQLGMRAADVDGEAARAVQGAERLRLHGAASRALRLCDRHAGRDAQVSAGLPRDDRPSHRGELLPHDVRPRPCAWPRHSLRDGVRRRHSGRHAPLLEVRGRADVRVLAAGDGRSCRQHALQADPAVRLRRARLREEARERRGVHLVRAHLERGLQPAEADCGPLSGARRHASRLPHLHAQSVRRSAAASRHVVRLGHRHAVPARTDLVAVHEGLHGLPRALSGDSRVGAAGRGRPALSRRRPRHPSERRRAVPVRLSARLLQRRRARRAAGRARVPRPLDSDGHLRLRRDRGADREERAARHPRRTEAGLAGGRDD